MELLTVDPRVKAALTVALTLILTVLVFRLGDQASADVQLDDSTVWVEHGLAGEILQINGTNGEIVSRVAVSDPGDEIETVPVAAGTVVLNRTAETARLVDPSTLRVGDPVPIGFGADDEEPDSEPVLHASPERVYVVSSRSVFSIDGDTLAASTPVFADLGSAAVENRFHVRHLHATILQLLGLDPNGLSYFYGGLDQKLTGVVPAPLPAARASLVLAG